MEFRYQAVTADGKNKKGKIEATSAEQANQLLKESGLYPLEVHDISVLQKDIIIGGKVKVKDMTIFCKQFSSIIKAGVVMLDALYLLKEQTQNKTLRRALLQVYMDVEEGEALNTAFAKHPKIFPSILVNMTRAGEESGNLELSMLRMAEHFEKEYKTKQSVKKAVTYPSMVLAFAVIVVIVLITFVVPTFVQMFADMGMDLPVTTRLLIGLGSVLKNQWYVILLIIFVIAGIFWWYRKTPVGKYNLSHLLLKLPIFGILNRKIIASRFTRTLSTLLASGLSLLESLDIVAKVVNNSYVEKNLIAAKKDVSDGVPLSTPIEDMAVFPLMVTHMIRVGEATGQLEEVLNNVADFYDTEVDTAVTQATTMIEPLVILFLAVVVGGIVLSIVQPMFQMYGGLGNM